MKLEQRQVVVQWFQVAPHAGAWIETISSLQRTGRHRASPPTRGRGLKRCDDMGQHG